MSATSGRQRRATAGKRMTDLVGKALEDDESFWNHETWAEDDSGNESFSDNDSEAKVDVFDSDFNDSETDNEEEEAAAGAAEEKDIEREDRNSRKKGGYVEKGGAKKKIKVGRRVMGDGLNAGLVLNVPGQAVARPVVVRPLKPAPPPAQPIGIRPQRRRKDPPQPPALRERKSTTTAVEKRKARPSSAPVAKKKRDRFTQEQLLLEAANDTEPDNHRWLLARKRVQDQKEAESANFPLEKKNVVQSFSSRRGALNTIHFFDMDHVPGFLTAQGTRKQPDKVVCAVTGRPAKYKDPKTGMAYADAAAFKELRRRYTLKEAEQKKPSAQPKTKAALSPPAKPKQPPTPKASPSPQKLASPPSPKPKQSPRTKACSAPQTPPRSTQNGSQVPTAPTESAVAETVNSTVETQPALAVPTENPHINVTNGTDAKLSTGEAETPRSRRRRKPSAKALESEC